MPHPALVGTNASMCILRTYRAERHCISACGFELGTVRLANRASITSGTVVYVKLCKFLPAAECRHGTTVAADAAGAHPSRRSARRAPGVRRPGAAPFGLPFGGARRLSGLGRSCSDGAGVAGAYPFGTGQQSLRRASRRSLATAPWSRAQPSRGERGRARSFTPSALGRRRRGETAELMDGSRCT